jgi:hypothetical protein
MTNGYCTVCPNKCNYAAHDNKPYTLSYVTVTKERTNQEIFTKYQVSKDNKNIK